MPSKTDAVEPSTSSGMPETSHFTSTQSATTTTHLSQSVKPSPKPQSNAPDNIFNLRDCLPMFMVAGGLIIACTILLVSTLILAWKVCQLSCRIKALSENADLVSSTEYWMGTTMKNKSKSDTETREASMLMADVSQMQEEKEMTEGETVKSDDQKKEVEHGGNSEEASPTPAEDLSSSKPQEEATDSQ